jgi:hypothetical protein
MLAIAGQHVEVERIFLGRENFPAQSVLEHKLQGELNQAFG